MVKKFFCVKTLLFFLKKSFVKKRSVNQEYSLIANDKHDYWFECEICKFIE